MTNQTHVQEWSISVLLAIYLANFTRLLCEYRAGRKRGKGIFLYEEGVKERSENPGFLELVNKIKVEPKVE